MNKALEALYRPEVEKAKKEGPKSGGRGKKKNPIKSFNRVSKPIERTMIAKKAHATGMSSMQWAKLEAIKKAIEDKLTEQRKFVVWWDLEGFNKAGSPILTDRKGLIAGRGGIPDSITLHRWRVRLKNEKKFDAALEKAQEQFEQVREGTSTITKAIREVVHSRQRENWDTQAQARMEIVCYRANAAEVFKAEQAGMGKTGFRARLEGLDVGEIVKRRGV